LILKCRRSGGIKNHKSQITNQEGCLGLIFAARFLPEGTMAQQDKQDVTAGKGRRDEVGRTGIYPGSGPRPDDEVPVRTPGDINAGRPGGGPGVERNDQLKGAERMPRKGDENDITD
jgi:hypothetical protein